MFEEPWYYSLDVTIKLSVVSSPQGNRVLVWAKQCLPEPTKVTFLRLVRGQFAASSIHYYNCCGNSLLADKLFNQFNVDRHRMIFRRIFQKIVLYNIFTSCFACRRQLWFTEIPILKISNSNPSNLWRKPNYSNVIKFWSNSFGVHHSLTFITKFSYLPIVYGLHGNLSMSRETVLIP